MSLPRGSPGAGTGEDFVPFRQRNMSAGNASHSEENFAFYEWLKVTNVGFF